MKGAAYTIILLALFLIASHMDYQDQVLAVEVYQRQVFSGELPDWDNRRPDCGSGVAP